MTRLSLASLITASAASLFAVTLNAHAQTPAPAAAPATATASAGELHAADKAFIADGTQSVATQRDAARIADSRSTDREVKAFAEKLVADYTKLSDSMRAASPRGVDVPRDDPDAAVLSSVKDLRGADFDKAYIEQVALSGQQKTLSAFQAEIASGRDAGLKKAATAGLPVIQADYAKAQELAKRKHLAG
jgi:putative membrane protein